jgi:hypothetical protein
MAFMIRTFKTITNFKLGSPYASGPVEFLYIDITFVGA